MKTIIAIAVAGIILAVLLISCDPARSAEPQLRITKGEGLEQLITVSPKGKVTSSKTCEECKDGCSYALPRVGCNTTYCKATCVDGKWYSSNSCYSTLASCGLTYEIRNPFEQPSM